LIVAPGNAGIAAIAECAALDILDGGAVVDFAQANSIDFVIVGPEAPLAAGVADDLRDAGLLVFGPSKAAAELEASKRFTKEICDACGAPTAAWARFTEAEPAKAYIREQGAPIVVKADGLAAGKGVMLCRNEIEAHAAVDHIMSERAFGAAGDSLVVEEFLEGEEASFFALVDGRTALPLVSAQDHKAAFDGDKGPNTGGMGAYSPAPVFTDIMRQKVRDKIMFPLIRAMKAEGRPYQGIIYAGLMLTKLGTKILEFNARFGDPETQPLLVRMESDIVPLFEACIDGTLEQCDLKWKPETAVCVVMAAKGYPGSYEKGKEIFELDGAGALPDVVVFHAGTKLEDGKVLTNGGRVLGVTATGSDTSSAIAKAYEAVSKIKWDGIHYRKDIGARGQVN
ncbi:MAG TPA: phosphoribosylamine--glycine ligase, partial [Nitrospina sp.]|nr:phosphoribosylamine--glycine ligase [Nitrospina sp.]